MNLRSLLPYSERPDIRERVDELFSREMLGAVIVGKFVGDYTAIKTTDLLGTDIGYTLGIITTISLFIYWERLETKAKQTREELSPAQSTLSDWRSDE